MYGLISSTSSLSYGPLLVGLSFVRSLPSCLQGRLCRFFDKGTKFVPHLCISQVFSQFAKRKGFLCRTTIASVSAGSHFHYEAPALPCFALQELSARSGCGMFGLSFLWRSTSSVECSSALLYTPLATLSILCQVPDLKFCIAQDLCCLLSSIFWCK